jgi:aryl-phospho-beta-D-glucosidase BglC (GH1 family)
MLCFSTGNFTLCVWFTGGNNDLTLKLSIIFAMNLIAEGESMIRKISAAMRLAVSVCLLAAMIGCESPLTDNLKDAESISVESPRAVTGKIAAKNAVASTIEAAGLEAAKAFDGNAATRWASAFADPQWIYVDLGTAQTVSRVVLNWEDAAAKSYQIQVSADAAVWTTVYTTDGGKAGIVTIPFTAVTARYVRMYGTARTTPYGYSLFEFEVYNDAPVVLKPVPGIFEAEAWDLMVGLQTEATADTGGGLNVGWSDIGDYLEYNINVSAAALYALEMRVASLQAGGSLDVTIDGIKLAQVNFPATGGWQNWQTVVSAPIAFPEGAHKLRLTFMKTGFNINWLAVKASAIEIKDVSNLKAAAGDSKVSLSWTPSVSAEASKVTISYGAATVDVPKGTNAAEVAGLVNGTTYTFTVKAVAADGNASPGVKASAAPFKGKQIPGQLEAEVWDGMYGFQTEPCLDAGAGLNVGWTDAGDWLEYSVNVPSSLLFSADFRVAGFQDNAKIDVSIDGVKTGTVAVPNSGGYQKWVTVNGGSYSLSAGSHTIRLTVAAAGFNLNWFKMSVATPEATNVSGAAGVNSATLTWALPVLPPGSISGTQITYTPNGPSLPITLPAGNNTKEITGLLPGTTYTFTIKLAFSDGTISAGVPVVVAIPDGNNGKVPQLKVVGSKLTDMNGIPVQLKGLSAHQLQNFPWGQDSVKNLIKQYGVNLVRAAMYIEENGYKAQPALMKARTKLIIDAAIANNIYVIVDWHIMGNPNNYTDMAKTFFNEIAAEYGSTPNILYEIVNEPTGVDWAGIKGYAEQVIPVIRAKAPNSVVIVGTPNYDTQPQDAWANKLNYSNLMYTVHFYCGIPGSGEYADKGQGARDNVLQLINKGMPIFVTEWGTSNYDGAGGPWPQTANLWIDFMKANKISWAFWSFANGGGGDSFLKQGINMNGPWVYNDLNPPGAYIQDKFR